MEGNSDNCEELQFEESQPSSVGYIIEYYQHPFYLFHKEHARSTSDFFLPHPIRQRFWQLVPPDEYTPQQARNFLKSYLTAVETQLGELIGKQQKPSAAKEGRQAT